jgi:CubicO group peptidase (beta-lactamase class C family)
VLPNHSLECWWARLVQEGLIDVDALVTKYVPEIADSGFGDATVRNLLDMAASYQFEEDYTPGPDIIAYRHSVGWYPAPLGAPNLHDFIASRKKEGEHGQKFRYMSPTTDLVGWVIEAASGMPYAEALSKFIWSKIGCGSSRSHHSRSTGLSPSCWWTIGNPSRLSSLWHDDARWWHGNC